MKQFPAEETSIARYLASFLKPNCVMEAELTRELRAERTSKLLVAERYEAGQLIVKRGQTVNRKIKAALEQLPDSNADTPPLPSAPPPPASGLEKQPKNSWILGGSAAAGALALLFLT